MMQTFRSFRSVVRSCLWVQVIIGFRACVADEPQKYAILVGVSKYQHADLSELRFPQRDAAEIGKLLNTNGYSVRYLLGGQATQDAIEKELNTASEQGERDGVTLLGFFGHGVQYGDQDYFIPFDAKLRVVTDAAGNELRDNDGRLKREPDPASLVPMQSMLDALDLCGSGHRLILADCCRNDPARAKGFRGRAFGANFTGSRLPSNTAIIFACGDGEQAFENDAWGHGAFTKAILDECATASHVTANELSVALHRRVNQLLGATGIDNRQTVSMKLNGSVIELKLNSQRPQSFNDLPVTFDTCVGNAMIKVQSNQWWCKTEVTRGQWRTLMKTMPWNQDGGGADDETLPATRIAWQAATKFCEILTSRDFQAGKIPANMEYRLPSLDQWKSVASDATRDLAKFAWSDESSNRTLKPVAQASPDIHGLHDIRGNVWEWCDSDERDKPAVGGSFLYPTSVVGSSDPVYYESDESYRDIGFRPILVSKK